MVEVVAVKLNTEDEALTRTAIAFAVVEAVVPDPSDAVVRVKPFTAMATVPVAVDVAAMVIVPVAVVADELNVFDVKLDVALATQYAGTAPTF